MVFIIGLGMFGFGTGAVWHSAFEHHKKAHGIYIAETFIGFILMVAALLNIGAMA